VDTVRRFAVTIARSQSMFGGIREEINGLAYNVGIQAIEPVQ